MKTKFIKICSLMAVPVMAIGLAACKKELGSNDGYTLLDTGVYPTVSAPYEAESKAAIDAYYEVANKHKKLDGTIDAENAEVQAAACKAAAELYAYACYNEIYVDKYVYFSNQQGSTNYGGLGVSEATKQDYKLIINADDDTVGYKYHYTIKKVDQCSASLSAFKSLFEDATLRFLEDTDSTDNKSKLYRFEGEKVAYDKDDYLTCSWVKGKDWGNDDWSLAKPESKMTLAEIKADIERIAIEAPRTDEDPVIHGNIAILSENIVSTATIDRNAANNGYMVVMTIDTEVANADEYSMAMLRKTNSSDNCRWNDDSFGIVYEIWDNGLFNWYLLYESWTGDIAIAKNGTADSSVMVEYSYSDRDTDMTSKLAMLNSAR